MHGEAGGLQGAFEELERAAFRRRDRAAAQQIAGDGDGIGGHSSAGRPRESGGQSQNVLPLNSQPWIPACAGMIGMLESTDEAFAQSLSSSLMLVLERVRSSTRLTMTAQ